MSFTVLICIMYIVFFLLSRPPWKSAIAEGVSVNEYSFNNNNNNKNNNNNNVLSINLGSWLAPRRHILSACYRFVSHHV